MSEQSEMNSHKRGRATFEVPSRKWPVVTRTMLTHVQELGMPGVNENTLVASLLRGYVLNLNVETHLKRALQEAQKDHGRIMNEDGDTERIWQLVKRLKAQLERVRQIKEEWPLEIVG